MDESSFDVRALDDLEIIISRATGGNDYTAYIRRPEREMVFTRLGSLPLQSLGEASDPLTYGERLFQWLFQDEVGEVFSYARKLVSEPTRGFKSPIRLRLRLSLDLSSAELHHLRWESLYTPDGSQPFSLTTAFSRFMHIIGPYNLPIRERPLCMRLIISNPEGINQFALDKIARALEKIEEAKHPALKLDQLREPPTLARIQDAVRIQPSRAGENVYHIVHLLAPAAFHDDQGYLILPDDAGRAQEVPFKAVAGAIVSSDPPPRLVFLAAPLITRGQESVTLVDQAQMLIEAGVQALVAIEPPIGDSNLLRFIRHFYDTLMRTGVIDVAMAEARAEIYNPDNWEWAYPVLYMRTPDSRLFQPLSETLESEITAFKIEGSSEE